MRIGDYSQAIKLWKTTEGMGTNDRDDSRKSIKNFLRMNPKTCFVAEYDGKEIIGTILGGYDGRRGLIYHLMVKPEHRKKGIAKKLLQKTEKGFKAQGARRAYIVAFRDNEAGNKFWENSGYETRDFLSFRSGRLD